MNTAAPVLTIVKGNGILDEPMHREALEQYVNTHREAFLRDLSRLIAVNSVKQQALPGRPFGEGSAKALAEARSILEEAGLKTVNYDNYVLAADFNEKEKGLDILAHLDVVPPGEGWTVTSPFEARVVDGKIYGRGTADDKGPALSVIYALKAVRELGIDLRKNVRLILGADEETGSSDIRYYYEREKEAPMSFTPDNSFPVVNVEKGGFGTEITAVFQNSDALPRLVHIEGGIRGNVVPNKAAAGIEGIDEAEVRRIAENTKKKTGINYEISTENGLVKVSAEGISAHSARPESGNNAITGLLALLAALPLASGENTKKIHELQKMFPHGDWYGKAAGIAMEDNLSGKLTISLNIIRGDTNGFSATFNSRTPICANDRNVRQVLKERCIQTGLSLADKEMRPPHNVPADSPFVKTLLRSYETYTGQKGVCLYDGGGTYVHNLKNGVAFGGVMPGSENNMHGVDEFAVVEDLLTSIKIYAQAIIDLCG
jgi:succinyl-diaminopimelate desuccinylase